MIVIVALNGDEGERRPSAQLEEKRVKLLTCSSSEAGPSCRRWRLRRPTRGTTARRGGGRRLASATPQTKHGKRRREELGQDARGKSGEAKNGR